MSFNARIRNKRDSASNWEKNNPVLLDGELIIVDTNAGDVRFKIGDGTKTYTQLPFQDETLYNVLNGKVDSALDEAKAYTDEVVANISTGSHDHDDRYYTKSEVDTMEFITVDDIDAICGATIQVASASGVTF